VLLSNTPAITFGLWIINRFGLVKYDFWHRYDKDGK
jgi:hypothetical protein